MSLRQPNLPLSRPSLLTRLLVACVAIAVTTLLAAAAARVARARGTTYILLGAPPPRRGLGRFGAPLPMRLLRLLPDVDVRIVAARRPRAVASK